MSVARSVARESIRVDLARAAPVAGLVRAIPVVTLVAVGLALHNPRSALTLGVGANLVATVSLAGGARVRMSLLILDVFGLGLATFVGSASASNEAVHLVVLWCLVAGILVLFGISAATAGVQSVIAFVVFGRFVDAPLPALGLAGFVMSGAAIEGAALLSLHLPLTLRLQRGRLSDAFSRLGDLSIDATSTAAVLSAESFDAANAVLTVSTLFGRSDIRSLRTLVDEGRRIIRRSSHSAACVVDSLRLGPQRGELTSTS